MTTLTVATAALGTSVVHADDCKNFVDATKVTVVGAVPDLVSTDDLVSFEIKIQVKDPSVLDPFPFMPFYINMSNGLQGSRMLFDGVQVNKEILAQGSGFVSKKISWKIPANFTGRYTTQARVLIRSESCLCNHDFEIVNRPTVYVAPKEPTVADIAPPVVTKVSFDRQTYSAGSKVKVTLKAVDESKICTSEEKDKGIGWHVGFKDSKGNYHNFFPEAHTDNTSGQYYAEFQLPLKGEDGYLEPGKYLVEVYDVHDVWDNYVHQSASSLAQQVEIGD